MIGLYGMSLSRQFSKY